MATAGGTLNLLGVLSETRRILHSHSRHFLALSVLFLLPLSFSLLILPTLHSTLLLSPHHPHQTLLRHTHTQSQSQSLPPLHQTLTLTLILPLLLLYLFLSLSASLTITYSTYHAFHNRPVKLLSSLLLPLRSSFLPLLATSAASLSLLALLSLTFLSFPFLLTKTLQTLLGFHHDIDYASNPYFLALSVVVFTLLVLALVRLKVSWALASVVVVVESKWGLEPLRRSARLMRGMKLTFLSLWVLFGAGIVLCRGISGVGPGDFGDGWGCLSFVIRTVVGSSLVTLLMLYSVASHAVMYMYCKALHGELAWEVDEEFAGDYVSLPFDDAKVPHVVFVAPQA